MNYKYCFDFEHHIFYLIVSLWIFNLQDCNKYSKLLHKFFFFWEIESYIILPFFQYFDDVFFLTTIYLWKSGTGPPKSNRPLIPPVVIILARYVSDTKFCRDVSGWWQPVHFRFYRYFRGRRTKKDWIVGFLKIFE